jgi:MFS family permease
MSRSVTTAGTFMGPIIAGFLYDLTMSYMIAFAIFAVVSLAAAFCMFLAKPPKRHNRDGEMGEPLRIVETNPTPETA